MKVKLYKCECEFAVFPFGNGMPVCIRDRVIERSEKPPLKQCTEKGCPHYNKISRSEELK